MPFNTSRNMEPMILTINLDQYFEGDFEDRIMCSVTNMMTDRLQKKIEETIDSIIGKEIRTIVAKKVDEMIGAKLNAPIPEVNGWGEATGKTTTFAEMVFKRWEESLKKAGGDYNYSNKKPLLQELITKYALDGLEKEAQASLKAINEEARTQVQQTIKDIVAMQLTKNIKIG